MFRFRYFLKSNRLLILIFLGWFSVLWFYKSPGEDQIEPMHMSEDISNAQKVERIDWHDYRFIKHEEGRSGPGERSSYELINLADLRSDKLSF